MEIARCSTMSQYRHVGLAVICVSNLICRRETSLAEWSSNRARTEGAELYRTLGVTPDAEYTEVMEAVERLKKKYSGDRKQARHSS